MTARVSWFAAVAVTVAAAGLRAEPVRDDHAEAVTAREHLRDHIPTVAIASVPNDHAVLELDGASVRDGSAMPVAVGHHVVVARVAGARWTTAVEIEAGDHVTIDVPRLVIRPRSEPPAPLRYQLGVELRAAELVDPTTRRDDRYVVDTLTASWNVTSHAWVRISAATVTDRNAHNGVTPGSAAIAGGSTIHLGAHVTVALYVNAIVPVGAGAGNTPDAATAAAVRAGADLSSLFAPNYVAVSTGATIAVQSSAVEAAVTPDVKESFRITGEVVAPASRKLGMSTAWHVGAYLTPWLRAISEGQWSPLRHTVWGGGGFAISRRHLALQAIYVAGLDGYFAQAQYHAVFAQGGLAW